MWVHIMVRVCGSCLFSVSGFSVKGEGDLAIILVRGEEEELMI